MIVARPARMVDVEHMVPDSLTEATRGEVGVRQLELRQPVSQHPNGLIPENDVEEPRTEV